MIVFSYNRKKLVKTAAIACLAAAAVMICAFLGLQKRDGVKTYASCDELGSYSTEATDVKAQREFLAMLGIKTEPEPVKSDTITIPREFDAVYTRYNALQKRIGLDLDPLKGQRVLRTVFRQKRSDTYVTLLIFKGHVAGGHISSGVFGEKYRSLVDGK